MAIARTFLDWKQPALPAVVEYLATRFLSGRTLDLDNVILVLPGGRAARRLIELLVAHCEQHELVLLPPEQCTVGTLPEYLYESLRPFASELTQQLAWVQALKATDPQRCRQYIPRLPTREDYTGWMDLGALLQRQHRELAADAIDFSQVAQRGSRIPGFDEQNRWAFLRRIQQDYLKILDDLQLWDLQTARLFAIDHNLCRTDKQLVLIGTTDMNIATRQMLDQVADQVTALVHAPATIKDHFDEHGCLLPDHWQELPIDIQTEQIHVVEGPVEQAEEMVRCLASLDGRYRADEVVVGVLDEQLVPQLLRQLDESQVPARWIVGRTVRDTAPYRLLDALSSYLDRTRSNDFAALVRHPDVSRWLTDRVGSEQWLADLDDYFNRHLQPQMGAWLEEHPPSEALRQIVGLIDEATEPLRQSGTRPLTDWATAIAQLLSTFYGDRAFRVDVPHDLYTLKSLQEIREGLLSYQQVPSEIDPTLTAAQAVSQLLGQMASAQIPSPHEDGQLELLGWLELPLDTAPALIITGFNEGNVPTSVNSDLFLPNQLRQQLDLVDNHRRYARDAYALSALQASRKHLTLIAGRVSADHDPQPPSRLAFATDLKTMAQRALSFFQEVAPDTDGSHSAIIPVDEPDSVQGIVVPKPKRLTKPITSISVTAFRTYLECPYRFYLRHVLRLEPMDDTAEELSAPNFGTLIHDVLSHFGQDPISKSSDPDKISQVLQSVLDELIAQRLGQDHLPAVDVQIAQARHRLRAFARWQAERTAAGWEIVHTETTGGAPGAKLALSTDTTVELKGRIDRIDRRNNEYAILDYKTGDAAKSPQDTHLKSGNWIDLQLPLYVHLARSLDITGPLQLGYVLLPKETDKVGTSMAVWDEELLASADDKALEVADDILAEKFWPPQRPVTITQFASICQEHAFRPHLEE